VARGVNYKLYELYAIAVCLPMYTNISIILAQVYSTRYAICMPNEFPNILVVRLTLYPILHLGAMYMLYVKCNMSLAITDVWYNHYVNNFYSVICDSIPDKDK